jgi:hypothetical protein
MSWTQEFDRLLPLLGHRNWILVTDKAYPLQSAPGITTLYTHGHPLAVLEHVIQRIGAHGHVSPLFYTDRELAFVAEAMAPGVEAYRQALGLILKEARTQTLPHDSVFAKLDQASKFFSVVVLKTDCMLAYSSVFIELDCGYWNAENEAALRSALERE